MGNRLLLPDDLKADSRISKGISQGEKKRKKKLIFDLQKRREKRLKSSAFFQSPD